MHQNVTRRVLCGKHHLTGAIFLAGPPLAFEKNIYNGEIADELARTLCRGIHGRFVGKGLSFAKLIPFLQGVSSYLYQKWCIWDRIGPCLFALYAKSLATFFIIIFLSL